MKWTRLIALLGLVVFAVAACDDDDNGITQPDPPAAPTGVQAAANGQTVTVSWTASADADDYRIELTTAGEADREQTTAGTSVDFTASPPPGAAPGHVDLTVTTPGGETHILCAGRITFRKQISLNHIPQHGQK